LGLEDFRNKKNAKKLMKQRDFILFGKICANQLKIAQNPIKIWKLLTSISQWLKVVYHILRNYGTFNIKLSKNKENKSACIQNPRNWMWLLIYTISWYNCHKILLSPILMKNQCNSITKSIRVSINKKAINLLKHILKN